MRKGGSGDERHHLAPVIAAITGVLVAHNLYSQRKVALDTLIRTNSPQ